MYDLQSTCIALKVQTWMLKGYFHTNKKIRNLFFTIYMYQSVKINIILPQNFILVRLARRKTGLSPPVKYFTDRSKTVLLLWIFLCFFLSCVCYDFVHVSLYVPCGHLLGKG